MTWSIQRRTRFARRSRRRGRGAVLRQDLPRFVRWRVHHAQEISVGEEGDVLTVEFTVIGPPRAQQRTDVRYEAFSFRATTDKAETDRHWNAIVGNGGEKRMRLVQDDGDCPGRLPRLDGDHRSGSRCRQTRVRCDDGDEKHRHRCIEQRLGVASSTRSVSSVGMSNASSDLIEPAINVKPSPVGLRVTSRLNQNLRLSRRSSVGVTTTLVFHLPLFVLAKPVSNSLASSWWVSVPVLTESSGCGSSRTVRFTSSFGPSRMLPSKSMTWMPLSKGRP